MGLTMTEYYNYPGFERFSKTQTEAAGSRPVPAVEPLIKADALAYVIYERPDLDLQERFMQDFGLATVRKDGSGLYMRGAGAAPFLYQAVAGPESRFLGMGFAVLSETDLETALELNDGLAIETIEGPGGGRRVRMHDPAGFIVDLVHGQQPAEPLPLERQEPFAVNTPFANNRVDRTVRPPLAPATVVRLGHVVISAPAFERMVTWYGRHVGLLPSDVMCVDDGSPVLVFGRLNRGASPADHHTVAIGTAPAPSHRHTAFEVLDIDALGQGQQFLKSRGWRHQWGIGRHIQGSQLFDYWYDPAGGELEHYADGDKLTGDSAPGYYPHDKGSRWMWGPDFPDPPAPRERDLPPEASDTLRQIVRRMGDKSRPWCEDA